MSKMKKMFRELDALEKLSFEKHGTDDIETIRNTYKTFAGAKKQLDDWTPLMEKIFERALEEDEEKKMYGPKTIQEILNYQGKFEQLTTEVSECLDFWFPLFLPLQEETSRLELQEMEQKRKMENLKRKALAELARMETEEKIRRRKEEIRIFQMKQMENIENAEYQSEKEKKEREAFERKQEQLRKQQEAEIAKQRALENMVAEGASMQFHEVLQRVHQSNPPSGFQSVCTALNHILGNVVKNPEDDYLRRVRLSNQRLQQDLFQWTSGPHCLASLGFELQNIAGPAVENISVQKAEWYLVLDEPDMETEMEEWVVWYEKMKNAEKLVQEALENMSTN